MGLAGCLKRHYSSQGDEFPGWDRLPILGCVFGAEVPESETELVICVTPRLLRTGPCRPAHNPPAYGRDVEPRDFDFFFRGRRDNGA